MKTIIIIDIYVEDSTKKFSNATNIFGVRHMLRIVTYLELPSMVGRSNKTTFILGI
jgi:hypothetical protein